MFRSIIASLSLAFVLPVAMAEETKTVKVQFEAGRSQTILSGEITGRNSVLYKLSARKGQFIQIKVLPGDKGADFNLYIPGRTIGDESLFNSLIGGRSYTGQLYKTGEHSINVFLNRAAARRGETAKYRILVRISDKQIAEEEVPAEGAVPQKVIDDCLAALRKQIPDREMKVISSKRGETSFVVDVKVDGVENPWRCYHDGTKCTGTEYQGEG